MGKKHQTYLIDGRIYTCITCHCHLLCHSGIISRSFQGQHGPAYLVDQVVNVSIGTKEERMLMTGMHTVADLYCNVCQSKIGWKYLRAFAEPQKYKEGKCIVEKAKIAKEIRWEREM